MGLIIFKIENESLLQTIEELNGDHMKSKHLNLRDQCITNDIGNSCATNSDVPIILPYSNFDFILQTKNTLYRLYTYK